MKKISIVAKFGGTSVQDATSMRQVLNIVTENPDIHCVILSASSGTTNDLLSYCQASDLNERKALHDKINQRHQTMVKDLGLSSDISWHIEQILSRLQSLPFNPDPQNIDKAISCGEDLSSLIFYHFALSQGCQTFLLDARHIIRTDDHYGKAKPLIADIQAVATEALAHISDQTSFIISQGFIGQNAQGQTTTLGRGGSDYSGALFAEALGAEKLYIYTDVAGVYSTDPRIIPQAKVIRNLCFSEMAEMANFGAKVLHPATLVPCLRARIPVSILSTFSPHEAGTIVLPQTEDSQQLHPQIKAITLRKKQILVTLKSLNMLDTYGYLAKVFAVLAQHHISIDLITTSEVSVALTVDGTNLGSHGLNPFHQPALKQALSEFAEITIEEGLCLVAVVGTNLRHIGLSQNILTKLDQVSVRLICYGASASSMGIIMAEDDAIFAVKMLHLTFIER